MAPEGFGRLGGRRILGGKPDRHTAKGEKTLRPGDEGHPLTPKRDQPVVSEPAARPVATEKAAGAPMKAPVAAPATPTPPVPDWARPHHPQPTIAEKRRTKAAEEAAEAARKAAKPGFFGRLFGRKPHPGEPDSPSTSREVSSVPSAMPPGWEIPEPEEVPEKLPEFVEDDFTRLFVPPLPSDSSSQSKKEDPLLEARLAKFFNTIQSHRNGENAELAQRVEELQNRVLEGVKWIEEKYAEGVFHEKPVSPLPESRYRRNESSRESSHIISERLHYVGEALYALGVTAGLRPTQKHSIAEILQARLNSKMRERKFTDEADKKHTSGDTSFSLAHSIKLEWPDRPYDTQVMDYVGKEGRTVGWGKVPPKDVVEPVGWGVREKREQIIVDVAGKVVKKPAKEKLVLKVPVDVQKDGL